MKWYVAVLLVGCTRTTELVPAREDGATPLPAPDAAAPIALCGNAPCAACSNGLDDDRDGLLDGFDPECSAPFDAHEDSFATGVHGEGQDSKCQDCFFDDDSGGDCKRARSCALDGTASSGTGACRSCDVVSSCVDSCLPRVPNGCDCYGCCEVWRDGAPFANVLLSASCSLAALDDPSQCVRCTPAADCRNPCGSCELCTGRSVLDLPTSCGSVAVCEGAPACARTSDCPALSYCLQGCCVPSGY